MGGGTTHRRGPGLVNAASPGLRNLHPHPAVRGRRSRVLPHRIEDTGEVSPRFLSHPRLRLGCRAEEFPFSPRQQGGFGGTGPGPPRRERDTWLERSGSLRLSSKALPAPGPSPACTGMLWGAPLRAPPGPRAAGWERPGRPRTAAGAQPRRGRTARPGAPAAASVRRFHLEGAARNCTRGAGLRRPSHGSARLGSARLGPGPGPWRSRRGLQTPRSEQAGRFVRLLTLTRSLHLPISDYRERLSLVANNILLCCAQSCLAFFEHRCWKEEESQARSNIPNQRFRDRLCCMALLGFLC